VILPAVVPRSRVYTLGGAAVQREQTDLTVDVQRQSLADVQHMLREIARIEVREQDAAGNPPSLVLVDNTRARMIGGAERRVEVQFGVFGVQRAMAEVERLLHKHIRRLIYDTPAPASGRQRTGALGERSSWEWWYKPDGGSAQRISGPAAVKTFGLGDMVWLKPTLPYASIVNHVLSRTRGKITKQRKSRRTGQVRTTTTSRGFLGATSASARGLSPLKLFRVRVSLAGQPMPGELSKYGTAVLTITANRGKQTRALRGGTY
jgi:hypothetical protein